MRDQGIEILVGQKFIRPLPMHCVDAATDSRRILGPTLLFWYLSTIRDLILAGFCLLLACSPALSEDIFKPTGRFAQAETTSPQSGRYLVKFTGEHCPPCKTWDRYELPILKAAGITPTVVDSTNGNTWGVTSLPTFWIVDRATGKPVEKIAGYTSAADLIQMLRERSSCEPVAVVKQSLTTRSMSHAEMVATHNQLHGGGQWTWPGDLATHLRTTHGVSTTTSVPAKLQPARVQQSASCPTVNCPTNRVQRRRGGFLGGLFR